ncbi:FtsX-like permease family protein [Luteolibacter sp. LG18]|uniref:ABC transporter permease n=1 Tax=Luteolibacter sp. LG18 TaxID=2819286 RepID=UPI002B31046C|nr:permease [Luteolibacter sp. LG18]
MPADSIRPLPRTLLGALLHPWTWRMAWRDSRSQRARLAIFSLAIVAGIAALVAIHSLKASVQTGIDTQAKSLLGSDLMVSSRQPIPADVVADLTARSKRAGNETSFSSMLYFASADTARLVQVRAFGGGYPFYGTVETEPADAWRRLQAEPGILLEPALLDQFQARVGDKVKLGSLELPILGTVKKAAPRSGRFGAFAPEAYVRPADLERSGLLGTTSMSTRALHLELPPGVDTKKLKESLRERFPDTAMRIESSEDRRETLGDALENFQRFLGILALASLVLGAIGVAAAVHAHVTRRGPAVAILRCLGCPGHLAFGIYFAQALALGFLGALTGAALGIALHSGVIVAFHDRLPIAVNATPEWWVVARTAAAGLAVCCGFALLPLLRIHGISPAATLRDGAVLERRGNWRVWPVYLLLVGLLVLLARLNDDHWKRALGMVAGLGVAFGVLLAVARLLVFFTRRVVRPSWPYLLRQGISNLHRPRNQTLLFLLSLGLGSFLLVTVLLVGNLIHQRLELRQFDESPNLYLVDVQPDQEPGVKALLAAQKLPVLESAPMVTMRIQSIRGVPVRELEAKKSVPKWAIRREFRSTYRDTLNATETIVAGEWKTKTEGPDQPVPLSLEEEIAKDLHVAVGDEMTLDVQGVPVKAHVTSLRKVDWSRFNLNFFMVFTPGVLEDAPGFHVVTTRVPAASSSGELQRAMVKQYPNVSAIDLTVVLETVRGILAKISMVVGVLAGFTVLAALPILAGTLLNGRDLRLRESALLRTLGASARQVRLILFTEYLTLGVLSALTGLVLAVGANAVLAKTVFKASPWPDGGLLTAAFVATSGLAVLGGLLLGRGVAKQPPLDLLRSGG